VPEFGARPEPWRVRALPKSYVGLSLFGLPAAHLAPLDALRLARELKRAAREVLGQRDDEDPIREGGL
jgi:hypothetical protein